MFVLRRLHTIRYATNYCGSYNFFGGCSSLEILAKRPQRVQTSTLEKRYVSYSNRTPLILTAMATLETAGVDKIVDGKANRSLPSAVSDSPIKKPFDATPAIRLDNIAKSEQDTRNYRGLQLENGLKVLLVSDPDTDIAAAALAVQVGHMSDPDDLPGLAHFCEHMLFLGTEKYPNENDYTTYLTQSSGNSNAATYPLMTKYHFHVAPDKLDGALDRFAQFFIGPLFTASATEREINAVNSEHEKNLSSDIWRIKQVHRHLSKPGHAYGKFGSGNKQTLCDIPKQKNIDVREALLKFHNDWYSANIMSLSVVGKDTLDELENMVLEKFSTIQNKETEIPSWPRDPFGEDKYAQKLKVVPVKDVRSMTISFTTDDLTEYYKSAPESYLCHLIGHEGKGSLLSELRELGWCNDLMAGHQNTFKGFGFFEIVVDLTKEGMLHVDDIIHIVFQYLKMLREEGPKRWIFDECLNLDTMRFRFKDKEQPEAFVTHAVTAMQIYPLEEVLTAPHINTEWRPDLITSLLDELVPSKCRVLLVSQSYKEEAKETEPYYKTKYCTDDIPKETIKRWETCKRNPNLALPLPNDFIPKSFDILPMDSDLTKHPVIILDTPVLRVWHKQDDFYLKPKACMAFDVSNPIAYIDPINSNLNHLMVTLLKDQLNEYLYDVNLAGLKLSVATKSSGIEFSIRGYSDKQIVLLQKLLTHLFDFQIDEKRFDILKEEYLRSLKNFNAEQPYRHSMYYLALILTENAWSNNELLDAMKLVTYERLMNFGKEFFQRTHVECFVYGNINKKKALEVADIINERLATTNSVILPLLERQMLKKREYKLCGGDSYLFERENEFHKSSCAQLYFQCGPQSDRTNVMVNLIAQIVSEPCHDCLRTKEQLGYIVFSGIRKVNGVNGIRIIVQSTKHPSFVEDRIENFLETLLQSIIDMPMDEYERHKEALAVKKLEKPKTIYQQYNKFSNEIFLSRYHFERAEAEVAILRTITKEEFIDYFKNFITRNGPERRTVALHIVSTQFGKDSRTSTPVDDGVGDGVDDTKFEVTSSNSGASGDTNNIITNMDRHQKITDLTAFKSGKELYPILMPYLDIRSKGARSKL